MKHIKTYVNETLQYLYKVAKLPGAYFLDIHVPYDHYLYKGKFGNDSLIVDVGCADDPDLSIYLINKYSLNAIAVDPTKKHEESLRTIERKYPKFKYLQYAISNKSGKIIFHESSDHKSGSILSEHTNIINDKILSYEVDSISLKELSAVVGMNVDLLKLDLEGAEYELLINVNKNDLIHYKQIFVEFHYHCTKYTKSDTEEIIKKLKMFGLKTYNVHKHVYLFYW